MKTPIYAGFYVMFSDPSFTGMLKEMKAIGDGERIDSQVV